MKWIRIGLLMAILSLLFCQNSKNGSKPISQNPDLASILLVTWDTVRADATGLENEAAETPTLKALAREGTWFKRAYCGVPLTGPSHASLMLGMSPRELGLFENGRYLPAGVTLAEKLKAKGYATAGFVSAFPLEAKFGFSRGFDHFDQPQQAERRADETVAAARAWLAKQDGPVFLWVHLYDAHFPYQPPAAFAHLAPYYGEIAFMDQQTGLLVQDFEAAKPKGWIAVLADHGEGLGDHGEHEHGTLLFEPTLRVPAVIKGPFWLGETVLHPVGLAQFAQTVLGMIDDSPEGWYGPRQNQVMAYSVQPYLNYGWAPQIAVIADQKKVIYDGITTQYDLIDDPQESQGQVLQDIPLTVQNELDLLAQNLNQQNQTSLSNSDQAMLASLGYSAGGSGSRLKWDQLARPAQQIHLLSQLDEASQSFLAGQFDQAYSQYRALSAQDAQNPGLFLRLAVSASHLGHFEEADQAFAQAAKLLENPKDLCHFWGLSYFERGNWEKAESLLRTGLQLEPDRVSAWQALAQIAQKRKDPVAEKEALQQCVRWNPKDQQSWTRLGLLAMQEMDSPSAISAFETSRDLDPTHFDRWLELGVCYQSTGQLDQAARSLENVQASHPGYPMACFKRAEIAAYRQEPGWEAWAQKAWSVADPTTRQLLNNNGQLSAFAP